MRLQLSSSKLVSRWITATLVASVFAMMDAGWLASWTALAPDRIWQGEVWRLVTWVLVEPSPMSLVFTCICIFKFGGELAARWGDRRLRRFVLAIVIAGSAVATLGALISSDARNMERTGGWLVMDVLMISWARQFPAVPVRLYLNLVELSGQRLVYFVLGITCLVALAYGPIVYAPELVACFAAAWYPRDWNAR